MPKSAKIVLAILIATLLGGSGYFYLKMAKKSTERPVNTPPKTDVIDTSDWQTYRNETLGFEIKMPIDWHGGYYLGRRIPDDPEFWQNQVGGADFNGPFSGTSSPQFTLRVKDSDLALDKFARRVGFGKEENALVNNLPAIKYILDGRNDKYPGYREALLLKNNDRYYYFEFSASYHNIDDDIIIWNKIISSFKSVL